MTPTVDNETSEFIFSDYQNESCDDSSSESDESEDNFEDSKDVFSESNGSPTMRADFYSPAKSKSTVAKTMQAKLHQSTSTPKSIKRSAPSPAEAKDLKKSRAHSIQ